MDTIIYKTNTRLSPDSEIKIKSNGSTKKFRIVSEQYFGGGSGGSSFAGGIGWHSSGGGSYSIQYTYELKENVKPKSLEELAAEESVAKAKEALKAAENALKAVKDGK